MTTDDRARIHGWLRARGAGDVAHPGGTLLAHLTRVADRLHRLGAPPYVRAAGLTHAAYGTDGFGVTLLGPGQRETLRDLVGEPAERLVYLYGACDRSRTWPALSRTATWWDRFTGDARAVPSDVLRGLVDVTIVNELDVVEQSPAVARAHGAALRDLFASWTPLCSPAVGREARRVLADRPAESDAR